MTLIGRVYKLSASGCDKIYIGSTYSKYISIRLAHHRQNHRNGWKDYKGLFKNGDPDVEVLDTINLENRDEAHKLRQLEEKYMNDYDNCINVRRSYLNPEERKEQRDQSINKYQNTPLGKLAMRKSYLNQKVKKIKNNNTLKTIHPSVIKQINNELKFISGQQEDLRYHKSNF